MSAKKKSTETTNLAAEAAFNGLLQEVFAARISGGAISVLGRSRTAADICLLSFRPFQDTGCTNRTPFF